MAKGMFSQGVCLLSDGTTTIQHIADALKEHQIEVLKRAPAGANRWFGQETLIVGYRPELNGLASIDLVNESWPDHMGDPKREMDLFGAWSMGSFGPLVFPGNLERALQQAWAWPDALNTVKRHRSFVRFRLSYVFGGDPDAPILPKDYDPVDELLFLNRLILATASASGVLCYFNPNGEVLSELSRFRTMSEGSSEQKKLPLLLWSNVRLYNINETYSLMDTVGNGQYDVRDIEAIFRTSRYEANDVAYYLRNVSHYLLETDRELKSGDAIDGPGDNDLTWMLESVDEPLVSPPRNVLRLFPKSDHGQIQKMLKDAGR